MGIVIVPFEHIFINLVIGYFAALFYQLLIAALGPYFSRSGKENLYGGIRQNDSAYISAIHNNVVMDGRDIGTVVLPDATVKIFLTASAEIRAQRRYKELIEKGSEVTYDEVYEDMLKRDYNDTHRPIAPLKQADDAVLADTSECTFDESLELILSIVKERLGE